MDFTLSDAIDAIRSFHCLPNDAQITIDGQSQPDNIFCKVLEYITEKAGINTSSPNRITAIKTLRVCSYLGLKDAKDVVDKICVDPLAYNWIDFEDDLKTCGVDAHDLERNCKIGNVNL